MDTFSLKVKGFADSSIGKESVCNAGDPSSIPGSGRPLGEGIGYPLQYSGLVLRSLLANGLMLLVGFNNAEASG